MGNAKTPWTRNVAWGVAALLIGACTFDAGRLEDSDDELRCRRLRRGACMARTDGGASHSDGGAVGVDAAITPTIDAGATPPRDAASDRPDAAPPPADAGPPPTATGYTEFRTSPHSRVVYVSASLGSDDNDGLSEASPKRTLRAGCSLLRDGMPDHLRLRRGDVWTNEQLAGCGDVTGESYTVGADGSVTGMIVLEAYGDDPARPRILSPEGDEYAFMRVRGGSNGNLAVAGLHFQPYRDNGAVGFMWFIHEDDGFSSNVVIEDCEMDGYNPQIVITTADYVFHNGINNLIVRRNVFHRVNTGGHKQKSAYIAPGGGRGALFEENVFVMGHDETPGAFDTAFYYNNTADADAGIVFRRNVFLGENQHGINPRAGAVIEDNLFVGGAMSIMFGGGDGVRPEGEDGPTFPNPGGVRGAIRGNVILEAMDIAPDQPRGGGIWVDNVNADGIVIEHNILANRRSLGNGAAIQLNDPHPYAPGVGVLSATIRHNTIYNWGNGLIVQPGDDEPARGVIVEDNVFQDTASPMNSLIQVPSTSPAMASFARNTYWSTYSAGGWFCRNTSYADLWCFDAGGTALSFDTWRTAVEPTAVSERVTFRDPERSLESYAASIGISPPTREALTAAMLRQSRSGGYRAELTADALLAYFREGFERL